MHDEDIRAERRINLKKMLFVLPSLITLSSVFCGVDAIRIAAMGKTSDDFYKASLLIVFAMIFDMLDGRVARMTKTQTAFGLQLDSLADVVSFGVAPALLVYRWSLEHLPGPGFIAAFLFVAAGAVRLARFNVLSMSTSGKPKKPGKYILGLPIPGAAGILISIVLANHAANGNLPAAGYTWTMIGITLFMAVLMVSNVRFRSFKDLKMNGRTILLVVFAVASSALVASKFTPAFVLVWLLGVYVGIGVVESALALPKRLRGGKHASVPPPSSH